MNGFHHPRAVASCDLGPDVSLCGDGCGIAGCRCSGRVRAEGVLHHASCGYAYGYELLCLSAVNQCFCRRSRRNNCRFLLFVGIDVGRCRRDCRIRTRRHVPVTSPVAIIRSAANRGYLIRSQLQRIALVTGQGHGLFRGSTVIPGTVGHLEGHLVADRCLRRIGIGVRRVVSDRGTRAGRGVQLIYDHKGQIDQDDQHP